MILFAGHRDRDTDIENGHVDTTREREAAVQHKELSLVLSDDPDGWNGGGVVGGRSKREGTYVNI